MFLEERWAALRGDAAAWAALDGCVRQDIGDTLTILDERLAALLELSDRYAASALGVPFLDRLAAVRQIAAEWAPILRARLDADR